MRISKLSKRGRVAAVVAVVLLAPTLAMLPAKATTTLSPSGPVVRDDTATVSVDPGGQTFTRATSTATYAPISANANQQSQVCVGLNPNGINNSPRSTVTVYDPGGTIVAQADAPLRHGIGALGNDQGSPPSDPNAQTRAGAWSLPVTLLGHFAGTYTVVTEVTDAEKTGTGACALAVRDPEVQTFEYRPWQLTFRDLLGGGEVKFNTSPYEFQVKVSGVNSSIVNTFSGTKATHFFSLPAGSAISLPSDPTGCVADPGTCLPVGSIECLPQNGCTPNIALVDFKLDNNVTRLLGVFDLQELEFVAIASANGHTRVLASGGRDVDPIIQSTMATLVATATANGLDAAKVLNTELTLTEVEAGKKIVTDTITLLESIKLQKNAAGLPASVSAGGIAVEAGLVIATWKYAAPAVNKSDNGGYGYYTEASQLVPDLPPEAGLFGGGPLRHDVAHLPSNCTLNGLTASATNPAKYGCGARTAGGLNVDTAGPANFPTLPTGSLPIYVPVETTGSVRFTDMEFVGYDTIALITQGVSAGVSIGTGTFLGIGAALFGKLPVPVNLSNVPVLWDKQSPTVQSVVASISALITSTASQVLSNPSVAALQAYALAYESTLTHWEALAQAAALAGTPIPAFPVPNPPFPPSLAGSGNWLRAVIATYNAYAFYVANGGDPSLLPTPPDPTTFPVPDPTQIPNDLPPVPTTLPPTPAVPPTPTVP